MVVAHRAWDSKPFRWGRDHLPASQRAIDASAWLASVPISTFLRYDGRLELMGPRWVALFACLGANAQLLTGEIFGLYHRKWRYGSFDELVAVAASALTAAVLLLVVRASMVADGLPRSVPLLAGTVALVGMCLIRYVWRLLSEISNRPCGDHLIPVVVFGAGEGGAQILKAMMNYRHSRYKPVALLDDDPHKQHLRITGIRVRGTREHLTDVARAYRASALLIAIPSADARLVRELTDLGLEAGLQVLVLPSIEPAAVDDISAADIRPVTEADLLFRTTAELDIDAIAEYITNRRVLVTGAGGSIGSELCRQLRHFEPSELMMLDRDESGLHALQLSLEGQGLLDSPNLILADIRDRSRLLTIFCDRRPDVIFHAAALKHLSLLESHPDEAWKTNVVGTQNVLAAALAAQVERVVNISTDKAADPTCVLGFSKRITERLTANAAVTSGECFVSVRFGNVLGSRGSIVPTFQAQIASGGPVTVTHPDVTRYLMTVEEAVRLTIEAGAIGRPGEVLVLDMGEPVRIGDIARRLIEQSGQTIRIVYTALRPGEKLHETLWGAGDVDERPFHPRISQTPVPPLSFDEVFDVYRSANGSTEARVESLQRAAQMFQYRRSGEALQQTGWSPGRSRASRTRHTTDAVAQTAPVALAVD
jgi:FlaA1/EpsC-like NDP-sugar epimerase